MYIASTGLSLSAFSDFRRLAPRHDIIHYHFPWPLMDLMHLSARMNPCSIITYHSDIIRQRYLRKLYSPIMHKFLGRVDRIIATSPQYALNSRVLNRYKHKTSAIPYGISDRNLSDDSVSAWRGKVGSGFFLFCGVLRYYKGLDYLIEAARITSLPVVIAGDGEMREHLSRIAPPNVTMLGRFSDEDREALLELCRAFVFPSHLRSEAFGVALLEAARAGRPMISCEIGTGTSFVNLDGETGFVVPPSDGAALARAMQRLASEDDLAARMGQNARKRYEQLFTVDRMIQSYVGEYRALLDARRISKSQA